MSVARVTEITAGSKKSFHDDIEDGLECASNTLDNVEGARVADMKIGCKGGKVDEYRVALKVTFVLH